MQHSRLLTKMHKHCNPFSVTFVPHQTCLWLIQQAQRNLAKISLDSKLKKDLKVRLTDMAMNTFSIMKDGIMEIHIRSNKALHFWIVFIILIVYMMLQLIRVIKIYLY